MPLPSSSRLRADKMQNHCPPSLIGPSAAIGQRTWGPKGDYGDIRGGWSLLRVRKAVPRKGLLLELGNDDVRAGLDEPSQEVCGVDLLQVEWTGSFEVPSMLEIWENLSS